MAVVLPNVFGTAVSPVGSGELDANFNALAVGINTIYPLTQPEITAGITAANIVNFSYPAGRVDRYLANNPGVTDMTPAFQFAINQARNGGADVVWGDTGLYNLATGALDATFAGAGAQYGINFRQLSTPNFNFQPNTRCGIIVSHSAYAVFDLTGCQFYAFYDLSLITATGSSPMTCFLSARNSVGGNNSVIGRFFNTHIDGSFSTALFYNYASEDGVHIGNYWVNNSSAAGAKVVAITGFNNILPGNGLGGIGMVSSFVTIATGSQSCIDHQYFGNQYVMSAASATSDVFYLDGCQHLKMFGPWMSATNARSYFYAEVSNAAPALIKINGFQGESNSAPSYGVLIANASGIVTEWVLQDVFWDIGTASIGCLNTGMTVDTFRIIGLQEKATRGIILSGTLQSSRIDYAGTITVSTAATKNFIIGTRASITLPGGVGNNIIIDLAGANFVVGGSLTMAGNAASGQLTGWGTPTAAAPVANFPSSGATLAQCGQALSAIIAFLKTTGTFGA